MSEATEDVLNPIPDEINSINNENEELKSKILSATTIKEIIDHDTKSFNTLEVPNSSFELNSFKYTNLIFSLIKDFDLYNKIDYTFADLIKDNNEIFIQYNNKFNTRKHTLIEFILNYEACIKADINNLKVRFERNNIPFNLSNLNKLEATLKFDVKFLEAPKLRMIRYWRLKTALIILTEFPERAKNCLLDNKINNVLFDVINYYDMFKIIYEKFPGKKTTLSVFAERLSTYYRYEKHQIDSINMIKYLNEKKIQLSDLEEPDFNLDEFKKKQFDIISLLEDQNSTKIKPRKRRAKSKIDDSCNKSSRIDLTEQNEPMQAKASSSKKPDIKQIEKKPEENLEYEFKNTQDDLNKAKIGTNNPKIITTTNKVEDHQSAEKSKNVISDTSKISKTVNETQDNTEIVNKSKIIPSNTPGNTRDAKNLNKVKKSVESLNPSRSSSSDLTTQKKLNEVSADFVNFSLKTVNNIYKMYKKGLFTDFVIHGADDRLIKVHKCILALRSTIFFDIVQNKNDLTEKSVPFEILSNMIDYIYTNKTKISESVSMTNGLLILANKYQLMDLKNICEKNLCKKINKENVFEILILANKNKDAKLKNEALNFISLNTAEVIKTDGFNDLHKDHIDLVAEIMTFLASKIPSAAQ